MMITATHIAAGSAHPAGDAPDPSPTGGSFRAHMAGDREHQTAQTRQQPDREPTDVDPQHAPDTEDETPTAKTRPVRTAAAGDTDMLSEKRHSDHGQAVAEAAQKGPFPTLTTQQPKEGPPEPVKSPARDSSMAQMIRAQITPADAGRGPQQTQPAQDSSSESSARLSHQAQGLRQESNGSVSASPALHPGGPQPEPAGPLSHLMAQAYGRPNGRHGILQPALSGMPGLHDTSSAPGIEGMRAQRRATLASTPALPPAVTQKLALLAGPVPGIPAGGAPLPRLSLDTAEPLLRLAEGQPGILASPHTDTVPPGTSRALPAGAADHGAAAIRAQLVAELRQGGASSITLQLAPAELGKVQIRVMMGDAGVQVMFQVERQETLELMRRFAQDLEQDLRNSGFADSQTAFSHQDTPQQPARPGSQIVAVSEPEATLPTQSEIAPRDHRYFSGMDLRL